MNVFINPGQALGGSPDPGCINPREHLRECDIALTVGSLAGKFLEAACCQVKLLQSHNLASESPEYPCVTDEANRWLAAGRMHPKSAGQCHAGHRPRLPR